VINTSFTGQARARALGAWSAAGGVGRVADVVAGDALPVRTPPNRAARQPKGVRTTDWFPRPRVLVPLPRAFQTSTRTVPFARLPSDPLDECSPALCV
jgi:hypothetical protein